MSEGSPGLGRVCKEAGTASEVFKGSWAFLQMLRSPDPGPGAEGGIQWLMLAQGGGGGGGGGGFSFASEWAFPLWGAPNFLGYLS